MTKKNDGMNVTYSGDQAGLVAHLNELARDRRDRAATIKVQRDQRKNRAVAEGLEEAARIVEAWEPDFAPGESDHVVIDQTNPEDIRAGLRKLRKIVMPWRNDGSCPPKQIRATALGVQVGIVDPWLGGYADPRHPDESGWGWKTTDSVGSSCEVRHGVAEEDQEARDNVDSFLEKQGYTLLGQGWDVQSRTN